MSSSRISQLLLNESRLPDKTVTRERVECCGCYERDLLDRIAPSIGQVDQILQNRKRNVRVPVTHPPSYVCVHSRRDVRHGSRPNVACPLDVHCVIVGRLPLSNDGHLKVVIAVVEGHRIRMRSRMHRMSIESECVPT